MRTLRMMVAGAAVLAAMLTATSAAADTQVTVPFHADSGDNCRYGATDGTLAWRFGSATAYALAVHVKGRVTDRPLPGDPGTVCRDDRFYSVATFTAYNGNLVVDSEAHRADNGVVLIDFTLGANSTTARIDRLVVQVCRHPSFTLPPSYCGTPVTYRPTTTQP